MTPQPIPSGTHPKTPYFLGPSRQGQWWLALKLKYYVHAGSAWHWAGLVQAPPPFPSGPPSRPRLKQLWFLRGTCWSLQQLTATRGQAAPCLQRLSQRYSGWRIPPHILGRKLRLRKGTRWSHRLRLPPGLLPPFQGCYIKLKVWVGQKVRQGRPSGSNQAGTPHSAHSILESSRLGLPASGPTRLSSHCLGGFMGSVPCA